MSYEDADFKVSVIGSGFKVTDARFALSRERGADGTGIPLEVTGTVSSTNLRGATIDTVTYVVGIKRYTQKVGIKLAETNVIDNTKKDVNENNGSGGGGCNAGAAAAAALAAAALALGKRNRKG
jgi:Synergist-CTERM protein sorting domain-containing protein